MTPGINNKAQYFRLELKYNIAIIAKFVACSESPLGIDLVVSLLLTLLKYLLTVNVGLFLPIIDFDNTVKIAPTIT